MIYNSDVNGIYYINANLPEAQSNFTGPDTRLRWTSNRIAANNLTGNQVSTAVVLKNQDVGKAWNFAASVEKRYRTGVWFKSAYSYGEARNTIDAGSIATGSWTSNAQSNDPNNPGLSISATSPGHRFFLVGSYNRNFFKFGASTVSMYWESRTIGNTSYTFAADANGDGGTSNDLIYIPRDQSEMFFQPFSVTISGVTTSFTAAQQAAAWDAYIKQDPYLSQHRGEYAGRNALFLPLVHRLDFSASQDFSFMSGATRHTFQFRVDIDNFTNLLNSDWGVSQRVVSNQPLTNPAVATDGSGVLTYRLRAVNGVLMDHTFERTAGITDVYRVMFSIKYMF
jgi:hypothetical protein